MADRYSEYRGNGSNPDADRKDGGKKPRKKRGRVGDVISGVLMIAALCVFLYSGYMLFTIYQEYKKGADEYSELESAFANKGANTDKASDSGSGSDTGTGTGTETGIAGSGTGTAGTGTGTAASEPESEDLAELESQAESNAEAGGSATQAIAGREVKTVELHGEEVTLPVMANPIDFEELGEINSDIIGWLKIRALDISYPVTQAEDNEYYLHRTFRKEEVFSGCIFIDCENSSDFTDQNTIVYGHNMKDGSMFGKLKKFREEETYNKSKYFWMFTKDVIYQYRIFSLVVVSKVGMPYQITFQDDEFSTLVQDELNNSEVDNTGVTVQDDDRIVTLSTCTGDESTRLIVVGRLAQMYASKD